MNWQGAHTPPVFQGSPSYWQHILGLAQQSLRPQPNQLPLVTRRSDAPKVKS